MNSIFKIFEEVQAERLRQNKKWGEQNHSPIEWMPILMEEVGEASKEALEFHFGTLGKIHPNHPGQRIRNYRRELIQIAAVAIQMIESVDRNELKVIES